MKFVVFGGHISVSFLIVRHTTGVKFFKKIHNVYFYQYKFVKNETAKLFLCAVKPRAKKCGHQTPVCG